MSFVAVRLTLARIRAAKKTGQKNMQMELTVLLCGPNPTVRVGRRTSNRESLGTNSRNDSNRAGSYGRRCAEKCTRVPLPLTGRTWRPGTSRAVKQGTACEYVPCARLSASDTASIVRAQLALNLSVLDE